MENNNRTIVIVKRNFFDILPPESTERAEANVPPSKSARQAKSVTISYTTVKHTDASQQLSDQKSPKTRFS